MHELKRVFMKYFEKVFIIIEETVTSFKLLKVKGVLD